MTPPGGAGGDDPAALDNAALDTLEEVRLRAREFVDERRWQQYQTPKNLAMAMIVEAGELVELFQWSTPAESARPDASHREAIAAEMADVLIYLVRMADVLDIDLRRSVLAKLDHNARKYPAPAG
ncbi:MAG: nucleotide pyrophosphohydrolase [Gammaproteobacteria bacterium]|nr:nucleotide pyrophosphohydrolase [Gammaproteobacteria bacterium]